MKRLLAQLLMSITTNSMFNLLKLFFKKKQVTGQFPLVVIGQIIEINKHPQADRLNLVRVDIGSQTLSIVCGANNIEVNQFVPVAMIGAKLFDGTIIAEVELRGQKSQGMLCSAKELGISEDHSGIMVLDKLKISQLGQTLDSYLAN